MTSNKGQLFLVPTPIGNMADITQRAIEILGEVDLIACEDTRRSGQLLKKLNIKKKLISYHEYNEQARTRQLSKIIDSGASVAVITDSGSPGISDPAYRVVRMAIDNDLPITALPGATAIIPALTASGLPTDRFFFEGFLPFKSAARKKRIGELQELAHTLVIFESPHRVLKTLADLLEILGDRQAAAAREISKLHEQFVRGSLAEIGKHFADTKPRGEFVLVVAGKSKK